MLIHELIKGELRRSVGRRRLHRPNAMEPNDIKLGAIRP